MSVVAGWGLGQYPWLLADTLQGLLLVVGLAAVIVLPALVYLLRLTQTESWSRH